MGIIPPEFGGWVDDLAAGLGITVLTTVVGALCALVLSFVLGLMALAKSLATRGVARVVIEFFRGTSLLVQLWWLYYVLPQFGYQLDAFAVAIVALALNFGAYGAEVVRGAINAIPREQREATVALNMNAYQRLRRVILPQAIVGMIPPFGNLLVQLLKSTPLVYTITIIDLTSVTQSFRSAEGETAFIFTLALVIYFVIAYIFTLIMNFLEARARIAAGVALPGQKLRLWQLQKPDETGGAL